MSNWLSHPCKKIFTWHLIFAWWCQSVIIIVPFYKNRASYTVTRNCETSEKNQPSCWCGHPVTTLARVSVKVKMRRLDVVRAVRTIVHLFCFIFLFFFSSTIISCGEACLTILSLIPLSHKQVSHHCFNRLWLPALHRSTPWCNRDGSQSASNYNLGTKVKKRNRKKN